MIVKRFFSIGILLILLALSSLIIATPVRVSVITPTPPALPQISAYGASCGTQKFNTSTNPWTTIGYGSADPCPCQAGETTAELFDGSGNFLQYYCTGGGGGPTKPPQPSLSVSDTCSSATNRVFTISNTGYPRDFQVTPGGLSFQLPTAQTTYSNTFTPGSYTAEARSNDNGTQSDPASVGFAVASAPPSTAFSFFGGALSNGWYAPGSVSLNRGNPGCPGTTSIKIDSGTTTVYSAPISLGDGIHTVNYVSADAGGTGASGTQSLKIDGTAPTGSVVVPPNWINTAASVTISASDATSGLAGVTYRVDGGASTPYSGAFSVSGEGTHTVQATATDNAGNTATLNGTVRIDLSAPTGTLTMPAGTLYAGPVTYSVSGADPLSGIASIAVKVDGTTVPASGTVSAPGVHTLTWTVTDKAGNSSSGTRTFTIDLTAPVVTAVVGGSPSNLPIAYAITAADPGSGVASLAVTLDGATTASSGSISGEGTHTLAWTATDNVGNVKTGSQSVLIDTVPPVLSVTVPAATLFGGTVPYAISASDAAAGLAVLDVTLNGAPVSATGSVSAAGDYQLVWTARDKAGNTASGSKLFTIDLTPPTISHRVDCGNSYAGTCYGGQRISLVPVGRGPFQMFYTLDNGAEQPYSVPLSVASGTHTISYRVLDVLDRGGSGSGTFELKDGYLALDITCSPGPTFNIAVSNLPPSPVTWTLELREADGTTATRSGTGNGTVSYTTTKGAVFGLVRARDQNGQTNEQYCTAPMGSPPPATTAVPTVSLFTPFATRRPPPASSTSRPSATVRPPSSTPPPTNTTRPSVTKGASSTPPPTNTPRVGNAKLNLAADDTPAPSETISPTLTSAPTETPTMLPSETANFTATATVSPTGTLTPTLTATNSPTATVTETPAATLTATLAPTETPTLLPTPTDSPAQPLTTSGNNSLPPGGSKLAMSLLAGGMLMLFSMTASVFILGLALMRAGSLGSSK